MENWYYELLKYEGGKECAGVIIEAWGRYTKFLYDTSSDGLNNLSNVAKEGILLAIKNVYGHMSFKCNTDGSSGISNNEHNVSMLRMHEEPSDAVTFASDLIRNGIIPVRMVQGYAGELEVKRFSLWINAVNDDIISQKEKKLSVLWYLRCLLGGDFDKMADYIETFINTPVVMPLKFRVAGLRKNKVIDIPESLESSMNQYSFSAGSVLFNVLGDNELLRFFDRIVSFIDKEELAVSAVNFKPVEKFITTDVDISYGQRTSMEGRVQVLNEAIEKDTVKASLSFVPIGAILNVFINCCADVTYNMTLGGDEQCGE